MSEAKYQIRPYRGMWAIYEVDDFKGDGIFEWRQIGPPALDYNSAEDTLLRIIEQRKPEIVLFDENGKEIKRIICQAPLEEL